MKFDLAAVGRLMEAFQSEAHLVANTLREKGTKRFERPLILAVAVVFGAYYLLYLPPQRKTAGLQSRIDEAKSLSQYTGAYKDIRTQLDSIYAQLPKPSEANGFLTQAVIESMRAEGLTSDSIHPPDVSNDSGLIVQKLTISAEVKFTDLISWLARLEASRPFIHVFSLQVDKSRRVGYCTISVGLSTLIPSGQVPGS